MRKSDKTLHRDVIAELQGEPSVDAAHIGIDVDDGIVTLTGYVETYAELLDAERTAHRVSGVRAIAMELEVRPARPSGKTDTDLARSAINILEWSSSVPHASVHVVVNDGWLTLRGEVKWDFQRQSANDGVRALTNVLGVIDEIVIQPEISTTAVISDIEAALKRCARRDSRRIAVSVDGHEVTLGGSVPSKSVRDLAIQSAWGTPGVRSVVDDLVITT